MEKVVADFIEIWCYDWAYQLLLGLRSIVHFCSSLQNGGILGDLLAFLI